MIIKLTDSDFESKIAFEEFTIVDFYAEWCGPCKIMEPHFEALSQEYNDKVLFGKVNIEESKELATKYNIKSIPTILYFKNGQIIDKTTGGLNRQQLKTKLDSNFK